MRRIFGVILLTISLNVNSQTLLDSLSSSSFSLEDTIGPALVKIAMNGLDLKVIDKQIDASRFEWQSNKGSWLNNLNANFNLNELNIKPVNPERNIFYPRYNFSLLLPLGTFITKSNQAKKAKVNYEETKIKKEVAARDLRAAVLTAYQNYKLNRYLLAIQETNLEDQKLVFSQVEQRFKNNAVTVDAFTTASRQVNEALARRVTLMHDVNTSKYELEVLIGMRLEAALTLIAPRPVTPVPPVRR
jgi:outer membrane protein TolC